MYLLDTEKKNKYHQHEQPNHVFVQQIAKKLTFSEYLLRRELPNYSGALNHLQILCLTLTAKLS